jgi:hypothetical protein
MAIDKNRPTYAVEAIPSDITNSVFLGNPAVDNLLSCVIAMNAEMWATKRSKATCLPLRKPQNGKRSAIASSNSRWDRSPTMASVPSARAFRSAEGAHSGGDP